jgi:hypothetical protein
MTNAALNFTTTGSKTTKSPGKYRFEFLPVMFTLPTVQPGRRGVPAVATPIR